MLFTNEIRELAPDTFLNMLKSGAKRVISKEYILNQLNVFPIPDRDTGSNLAAMMRYFLAQHYPNTSFRELLRQIADSLLSGACGNSGMIFSAFFMGLASHESETANNRLSIKEYVRHLSSGVKHAYQAVAVPAKGTMLTVMSAWVEACEKLAENTDELIALMKRSYSSAEQALKQTQFQLPELTENQVIDAGAMGFVEFIAGMNDYLVHQDNSLDAALSSDAADTPIPIHIEPLDHPPIYQYCAETLLATQENNIDAIKAELATLGDSLVVNRSPSNHKIHLHTNDLLTMSECLKKFGRIEHQKIDSTKAQWQTVHARKNSIALVTDSSADIPFEWLTQEQIQVFPLKIRVGDHQLLDRLTITLPDLYHKIHDENQTANTSAPSAEMIHRQLSFLTQHYDSVIILTLSSHLSSTYQLITSAAARITHKKITVIDSRRTSAAQGLLLMLCAKWISQKIDHDTLVKRIEQAITNTHIFVAVNDFKTVVKSGRAPKMIGLLAAWSRIKPIISMNAIGKPTAKSITFGKMRCWNKIAKLVLKIKKSNGINSIGIVHSANPTLAKEFADFMALKLNTKINFIIETSCILGLHAGKDCVAIAVSNEAIA